MGSQGVTGTSAAASGTASVKSIASDSRHSENFGRLTLVGLALLGGAIGLFM